ncbi:hypothetical protein LguiA_002966 [Lonicera macranthoides]
MPPSSLPPSSHQGAHTIPLSLHHHMRGHVPVSASPCTPLCVECSNGPMALSALPFTNAPATPRMSAHLHVNGANPVVESLSYVNMDAL